MKNPTISKNPNTQTTDVKVVQPTNNRLVNKSTNGQKIDHGIISSSRTSSSLQMRVVTNGIGVNRGIKSADSPSVRANTFIKRNDIISDTANHLDDQKVKKSHVSVHNASNYVSRNVQNFVDTSPQENPPKSKNYASKIKALTSSEPKYVTANNYSYKNSSNNIVVTSSCAARLTNHSSSFRDNHTSLSTQNTRPPSRNEAPTLTLARKNAEQQNTVQKNPPVNFPPLRAPQSIVDVRHPFVTEARTKRSETTVSNIKSKPDSLQSGIKELYTGQTYHSFGNSPIAGIPSIQSLANVTANISPYVRADSYGQTVANVLFPETAQFPQSPPFSAPRVGQINQYPTYDPSNYANTPVNPVMTQYSPENSIAYPQYESPPQFVQTNHYATSDINNSQYQFQAGVGQIQESPLFLQSVQSPIAVSEQYAASNYARAVRTELMPRLHRPPRFNK